MLTARARVRDRERSRPARGRPSTFRTSWGTRTQTRRGARLVAARTHSRRRSRPCSTAHAATRARRLQGRRMIRVAVVGTGYVGLVTGACLADFGNDVICVDVDAAKIDAPAKRLRSRSSSRACAELVRAQRAGGAAARSTTDLAAPRARARRSSSSPSARRRATDGSADTRRDLRGRRRPSRSTSTATRSWCRRAPRRSAPRATCGRAHAPSTRKRGAEFDVASNPEFLREGSAIETFMRPDRVVIGAETPRAERHPARDPRAALSCIETPMVVTDARDRRADQVRLERVPRHEDLVHQRDREPVRGGRRRRADGGQGRSGMDRRIGRKFLHAGPGYGGSCFPKDTLALRRFARAGGRAAPRIVETRRSRPTSARWRAWSRRSRRRVGSAERQARRACSGSRSSPTPTTCARRRRSTSSPGSEAPGRRGRGVRPGRACRRRASCRPIAGRRVRATTPTRPRAAPTRCAIVTEWNEFRKLDLRAAQAPDAKPGAAATCATSTIPTRSRPPGCTTSASAAAAPARRRRARRGGPAGRIEADRGRGGQAAQGDPRRARLPHGDAARRRPVLPEIRAGLPVGRLSRAW